jgi:hypothetical protein
VACRTICVMNVYVAEFIENVIANCEISPTHSVRHKPLQIFPKSLFNSFYVF